MANRFHIFATILITAVMAASCSTTRVLQSDEYRLAKNKIEVTNDKKYPTESLETYLKQKPNTYFIFGWNPFLNIYNWQNGKGKGWDKFVKKIGVAPVVYDPDMVDSSIENLTKRMTYLGYYDSKVTSEVRPHRKNATVIYKIELGNRLTINDISYDIEQKEIAADFFADTAGTLIHPGDFLSEDLLEKEAARATANLRNKGYFDFNKNFIVFEADSLDRRGTVSLKMSIKSHSRNETTADSTHFQKYYFNKVEVYKPESLKIRQKVLKGLNTVIPGKLYNETDVSNTYSRLSSMRIFNSINLELNKVADTNLVDCKINLAQTRLQGFKVNLEGSINSTVLIGISPQLSYYHKNIFHGGEWLNLGFMGNFQFKAKDNVRSNEFGVSAGLSFPKFLGLPYRWFTGPYMPRTDVNLSYNYQSRPEYQRNIISLSYGYSGMALSNHFRYQVYPVQLSIIELSHLDEKFYKTLSKDPFLRNAYQNHFDLGLGSTFHYSSSREVNPKESYFYGRLTFDISGNLISAFKPLMKKDPSGAGLIWRTPYSQYVRTELTLGRTWKFGKNDNQAVATRLVGGVGYAYGNSSALPFEKHFYGGGANSLRGWPARSVGPGTAARDTTFVIPNQTGDIRLEANIEYRFKMFWKFEGAVFADAGNVWTFKEAVNQSEEELEKDMRRSSLLTAKNFGKSIAADWGLGLRLDFDFLVVRFDFGMRVHDPARKKPWLTPAQWFKKGGYGINFGVGYPF